MYSTYRWSIEAATAVLQAAIALLILGGLPMPASANLGARPAYVFVDLSKRNPSGSFTVSNLGGEPQTYRARAMHFALKPDGSILPAPPDKYSLAPWIKFNPKEFTLPPHSSRRVRFTIVQQGPPPKPHEYWGAIEFAPLSGASFASKPDGKGHVMQFQVITALLIPIYGEMPGIVYGGRITDIAAHRTTQGVELAALISNTGEGGLRLAGHWQVYSKATGELVKTFLVEPLLVLPQEERHLQARFASRLPPGRYTVALSLKYIHGRVLSGRGDIVLP